MKNLLFLLLFAFLSGFVYAASDAHANIHSEPHIVKTNIFGTFIEPLPKVAWYNTWFRNYYFIGSTEVTVQELATFLKDYNEEAYAKFSLGLKQRTYSTIAAIISIITFLVSFLKGGAIPIILWLNFVSVITSFVFRIISNTNLRRGLRIYNKSKGYGNVSK